MNEKLNGPDPKNIPYLINLMDDESDFVRDTALRELRAFGSGLREHLQQLTKPLSADQTESTLQLVQLSDEALKGPKFSIGQLVRHCRYGYRGIIAAIDSQCQADDTWYENNQTQPKREQAWYHVIVSDSEMATYPAESSLMSDSSDALIVNPMLEHFFSRTNEGLYIRNDRAWFGREL
jgi:heat shock protein HspQ